MIYLIAFLHAIPVLVVGLGSGNRGRTIGTAAFMAVAGVVTGDAAYIAVDLIAVGLALGYCLSKIAGGGDTVSQQRYQPSAAGNSTIGQTNTRQENGYQTTTSGGQSMGFFSAMRLSSVYDQRIKAYGFEPRSLPPDLHSTVCSSFERRAERYADMGGMTGSARSEYIRETIELAADLVVLCCIGPTAFAARGGQLSEDTIPDMVRSAIASGLEGSLENNVMNSINQAGFINLEFVDLFRVELKRQRQVNAVQEQSAPASYTISAERTAARQARAAARLALQQSVTPIDMAGKVAPADKNFPC